VLAEAELEPPTGRTAFIAAGRGRSGSHTEHLGPLLAEMQVLARQHPGASW
jgi:ring-1,2-phenylacetyl-CoA epoxidase subunit PaaC